MEKFRYAPLSQHAHPIRLITLHPGEYDDQIHVELHDAHLPKQESVPKSDEIYRVPEYTALSYVWGAEVDQDRITVMQGAHTGVLRVTKNLTVALCALREPNKARVLWIDAICINQEDLQERSSQVAFMASIYKHAQLVLIWLGPNEDDGEFALAVLNYWGSRLGINRARCIFYPVQNAPNGDVQDRDRFTDPLRIDETGEASSREKNAVFHLIHREWWRRLWVRQEVAMRVHVKIRCGSSIEFDFAAVLNGALFAFRIPYDLSPREPINFYLLSQNIASFVWAADRPAAVYAFSSLRFALSQTRWREPVDAIYAVLDLLPESEKAFDIRPDYARPVSSVFKEVVVKMLQVNRNATFLASCELSSKSLPDLPSWVPDWSSQIGAPSVFNQKPSRILPHFYLEDNGTLAMLAMRKAEVVTLHTFPLPRLSNVLRHITRTLPKDLSHPYIGGGDLCGAYAEAFVTGWIFGKYNTNRFASRAIGMRLFRMLAARRDPMPQTSKYSDVWDDGCDRYLSVVQHMTLGRSFITTKEGYVGLAPAATRSGDILFVVLGCNTPMILRPTLVLCATGDHQVPFAILYELKWLVVGSCYTPGLMNNEAIHEITRKQNVPLQLWANGRFVDPYGLRDQQKTHPDMRVSFEPEALKMAGLNVEMVRLI